jgi:glycosyltransferase involved in cell wall biosynthesis
MRHPRVLVIAYDFPPHGAIGTMRTLRLVRHLAGRGWDVSVLTGTPSTYLPGTPIEPALEAMVPAGVRVLRAPAVRAVAAVERLVRPPRPATSTAPAESAGNTAPARGAAAASGWRDRLVRAKKVFDAAMAIPDKESPWIAPAVAVGLRALYGRRAADVIYSSAPPWSGQAVALALARLSGKPWVADFRDPWSRAPWRDWHQPFRQRAAAALERRVVARADAVLFVTRANRDEFASFYGSAAAARFHLVPNGCDPSELDAATGMPPRDRFVLLHAGTLYGARNPMPLIEAIARLVREGALDPAWFRLRLLGSISLPVDLAAEARRLGIGEVLEIVPRVTRAESLQEMKAASALLLVQPGTTVSVPGKAYEYLAAGRPLFALSEEGETADLVRSSGIGVAVRPEAGAGAIGAALLDLLAIAAGPYAPPPRELYDGEAHAAAAARVLERLARRGDPAAVIGSAAPAVQEERRP